MTTTSKPVRRETFSTARYRGKSRPIVIDVCSTYVKIRLKGCRESYTCTYDQLLTLGAKNSADARRRERLEQKKAARRG